MAGERAHLSLWTDFAAAGGSRLGDLGAIGAGVARYAIAGDGKFSVNVSRARWVDLAGDVRHVLRIDWPEGTVDEGRIARVADTIDQTIVSLNALPVFDEFATAGPIVRVVGGMPVTRIAAELSLATWLAVHFLTAPAVSRLGFVLGTLERNPTLPNEFDAATPGELLRALFDAAGLEVDIVRTSESVHTLNGRLATGASVPAITLRPGANLLDVSAAVDDQALATVVVPLGETDADTGDRATMADAIFTISAMPSGNWVSLRDGPTGASPITVDTQWCDAAVHTLGGGPVAITNSRASDGSVELASVSGLTVGTRLKLCTLAGDPLVEVTDRTSVAARGRRVLPVRFSGLRSEANLIPNGRFLTGVSPWTPVNAGASPMYSDLLRSDLAMSLSGAANGARSAGTGTGTPLALKGLSSYNGKYIRAQDEIHIGGVTLPISVDAIPNSSGALVLSVGGGGLPANYGDNTPFSLVRKEQRTLTLDGDQSVFANVLQFADSNTDQLPRYIGGTLVSGGISGTVNSADYGSPSAQAGKLYCSGSSLTPPIDIAGSGYTIYTTVSANAPVFSAGDATATLTVTGHFGGSPTAGVTRMRWFVGGQWFVCKVTAIAGAVLTLQAESVPTMQYPTGSYNSGSGQWEFQTCDGVVANGTSFTFSMTRETRTLFLNGSHTAGATSVAFKAQSNIATRHWVSTDTITLQRSFTGTLDLTAIGSVTEDTYTDPDTGDVTVIGYILTATFNAGTSTMDDIASADWSSVNVFFQSGTSGTWRLTSIVSTTATFYIAAPATFVNPLPTGVVSSSWTLNDTYALTGSASWGNDGRVTLTLASAVPAGRSYARGRPVVSNWHSLGYMRLHAALSAGDMSISISAVDSWTSGSSPSASLPFAVYRVMASASTIPITGNTMIAAAHALISGGTASVTVTAANANSIADNEVVTITRPSLLRATDDAAGSAVRLIGSVSSVSSSSPALETPSVPVTVPAGATRTVTAFVTLSLSAGAYPTGSQPIVALVDGAGAILNSATIAATTVTVLQTPTIVRLIVQATLTVTTSVGIRLVGGTTDSTKWVVALDAMLCETARTDVPFVVEAWGNQLALRGADLLALRRLPVASVTVDIAALRRWSDAPASTAPIALGQSVVLPTLGVTRRVLTYERSLTDPMRGRVEVGTVPTELSRRVAANGGA